MLEKLDLAFLFARLREEGYLQCHFYAERTFTTEFSTHERINHCRHFESGGLSVELFHEARKTWTTYRTNQFSTDAVLKLLQLPPNPEKHKPPFHEARLVISQLSQPIKKLQALIKKIQLETSLSRPVGIEFRERRQIYQSANSPEQIHTGETESGELKMDVCASHKGKSISFSHSLHSSHLNSLWEQIDQLVPLIHRRIALGASEKWPLPEGRLPVGWSHSSLAKLTDCFLRGFEGDLVLSQFSYLSQLSLPVNFPFQIFEKEASARAAIDHEGSPRKPLLIFDGKKPKFLATNNKIAREMAVPSTGHCRRATFDQPSTIGFWHPVLRGLSEKGCILELMKEGIWVEDILVQKLDITTGIAVLEFSQVNLVHQGEIGEAVEPFTWTLSIPELMGTLHHFSHDLRTTGIFHFKQKQRILTEYTTPAALSSELNLPGTVPKSHYW
jgi:predicted Zn-dependent protease